MLASSFGPPVVTSLLQLGAAFIFGIIQPAGCLDNRYFAERRNAP